MALKSQEVEVKVVIRVTVFTRLPKDRLQEILRDPEQFFARFPRIKDLLTEPPVLKIVKPTNAGPFSDQWVNDTPEHRPGRGKFDPS
jgi:hypothetical protein